MLTPDREYIQRALEELRRRETAGFVRAVERIVAENVAKGRLRKFRASGVVAHGGEYVERVAEFYRSERDYVVAVQNDEDPVLWEPLYARLQKWAYWRLSRLNFLEPLERQDHAQQCAADAGVTICEKRFPYDTHFGAWAQVIVQYVCSNHVRRARRAGSLPDQAQISLDAWDGWQQAIPDSNGDGVHRAVELRHDLLQHIAGLADAQRQFVLLHYFEQKSYEEIAELMGRSKNALYKLNFDALANLRKKIGLAQHNYE